jgi:hypothetical protein
LGQRGGLPALGANLVVDAKVSISTLPSSVILATQQIAADEETFNGGAALIDAFAPSFGSILFFLTHLRGLGVMSDFSNKLLHLHRN